MKTVRLAILSVSIGCGGGTDDVGGASALCPTGLPAGSIALRTDADVVAAGELTETPALVACETSDLTRIDLPKLLRVELFVRFADCPGLESVALPALESAGSLWFSKLPVLQQINFGGLVELTNGSIASSLELDEVPRLDMIRFPALERAMAGIELFRSDGRVLELPLLKSARGISLASAKTQSLVLPELEGPTIISLDNDLVREVSLPRVDVLEHLEVQGCEDLQRFDAPVLEHRGSLSLQTQSTQIEAPNLRYVGGSLQVVASSLALSLNRLDLQGPSTFSLSPSVRAEPAFPS